MISKEEMPFTRTSTMMANHELDIVYLGSSLPKLTGGFGFTLNYDRWRLNAQFNYRVGNKILNLARSDAESMITNNNLKPGRELSLA